MDEARARAERARRRDPDDEAAVRRARAEALRSRPAASLLFIGGPRQGDELRIEPGSGPLTVGRSRAAEVFVADPWLARRSFALSYEDERVRVEQLGSRNGCYVNGVLIRGPRFLEEGDELRMGQTVLVVSYGAAAR